MDKKLPPLVARVLEINFRREFVTGVGPSMLTYSELSIVSSRCDIYQTEHTRVYQTESPDFYTRT